MHTNQEGAQALSIKQRKAMEEKKQLRTKRAKNGERTQKMFSFRMDEDVRELLALVNNKGRAINDAVRKALGGRQRPTWTPDDDEVEERLEDTWN